MQIVRARRPGQTPQTRPGKFSGWPPTRRMDQGIGRILATLKEMKVEQNTLVLFLSDNGACDEVIQPDWYDVPSKTRDGRPVKVGNNPAVLPGPEDVWQSYGVPWANVSDTPYRLYKHFVQEGGIASPFIARWPATIPKSSGSLRMSPTSWPPVSTQRAQPIPQPIAAMRSCHWRAGVSCQFFAGQSAVSGRYFGSTKAIAGPIRDFVCEAGSWFTQYAVPTDNTAKRSG